MERESVSGTHFLVETFAPGCKPEKLRADSAAIHAATELLARLGTRVEYVDSLLVAGEETALHFFAAGDSEAVEHVLREAGIEAERISPVVPALNRAHGGVGRRGTRSGAGRLRAASLEQRRWR